MNRPTNDRQRSHGTGPPKKFLSPVFNDKSKRADEKELSLGDQVGRPPLQARIAALKKLRSKPSFTYDPRMIGVINRVYDPKRDQKIYQAIKAAERALAVKKQAARNLAKSAFSKAHAPGMAKASFNRSSGFGR